MKILLFLFLYCIIGEFIYGIMMKKMNNVDIDSMSNILIIIGLIIILLILPYLFWRLMLKTIIIFLIE